MKTSKDLFGDRMKGYESQLDDRLDPTSSWIIRLDGNSFSKLTRKIKALKPYDKRISGIMEVVCGSLIERFDFATVYTQSDEITCVPNEGTEMFSLRVNKLNSLVAAHASVVFYREFIKLFPDYTGEVIEFDSRVIPLPSKEEVLNALIWRQRDCTKNAKALLAQSYFPHKKLEGLSADEQVFKVFSEKFVDFESDMPDWFKYGIIVKRKNYIKMMVSDNGEKVEAIRTKTVYKSFKLDFSEENLNLILQKKLSHDSN